MKIEFADEFTAEFYVGDLVFAYRNEQTLACS